MTAERRGGVRAGRLAAALALSGALAGCVTAPPPLSPVALAQAPVFDPFTFFAGASAGEGTLTKALADPVPVRVTSSGRIVVERARESAWAAPPRRVLVIDQVVTEGDKPPRKRQWRIHEVAPGRYAGSLTGALSPIEGRAEGNRLVLSFTIKGGLKVRQELTLSADGRRADNLMTVSELGVTVAVLAEDIRKTP
jgi:hypothetical protein